ncbi:MAG TPA: Mrp/NBP35 family ATP-binding protein [Acidimicrobiia bacterium]|nr:Mrp/NBP35 family ATP-binding protein [Acidimicrobiia bacterium]
MVDVDALRAAIGAVQDPELHRGLEELGMVRDVTIAPDGSVHVHVALTVPGCPMKDTLRTDVTEAATSVEGVNVVTVEFTSMSDTERSGVVEKVRGSNIREVTVGRAGSKTRVIGISSGKGGVGKSSVTANLGVALAARGHSVGIIDADVWGFSIPKMLGVDRQPVVLDEVMLPPVAYGVGVMSMDFFIAPDQAVIWRGPMLHKALEQFLVDVLWDDPDFLLIDMPPGTGDVAISLSQFLPRSETIVVTTPQPTAERVAIKAGLMAGKVNQDLLGVVENMSWFTGDDGKRYAIFGEGGGATLAASLNTDLLVQIPLVPAVRDGADRGLPAVVVDPDGEVAAAFDRLAEAVEARRPPKRSHPELVVNT